MWIQFHQEGLQPAIHFQVNLPQQVPYQEGFYQVNPPHQGPHQGGLYQVDLLQQGPYQEGLYQEGLHQEGLRQQGPHQEGRVCRERTRVRTAHSNFKCAEALFYSYKLVVVHN